MEESIRKETYDRACFALAALVDIMETHNLCRKQVRLLEDGRMFFNDESAAGSLFGKLSRLPSHVQNLSQAIQLTLEPKQGDWVTDPITTPDIHELGRWE
jgi:hypothetical protein